MELLIPFALLAMPHAAMAGDAPEVVVVEGSHAEDTDPNQSSASVTVIEVDERLSAGADLGSVVESASGTVIRRLGGLGDYAAVSVRGSSARQVQVFLDGVPINPEGSEAVNLSEWPLSSFRRIELYRGNAPVDLAAAPIGGVLNLVSGDLENGGSGALSYGLYDTRRVHLSGQGSGTVFGHEVDGLLVGNHFSTAGNYPYFSDNATIYNQDDDDWFVRSNNDKSQQTLLGRVRFGDDSFRLSISDAFLYRKEGLPGSVYVTTDQTRLETMRHLGNVQVDGVGDSHRYRGRLWGQRRDEEYDDRLGELGLGEQWHRNRYQTLGALAYLGWSSTGWLTANATVSGRRDSYIPTDLSIDIDGDERLRRVYIGALSANLFAFTDQVTITPVVQGISLHSVNFGDDISDDTTQSLDPRVGLLISPSNLPALAIKANAGRYLRPPDFTELFGDRGTMLGNAELTPEYGSQFDLGVRIAPSDRMIKAVDLTGFLNAVTDQIIYVQNSQFTAVPMNFGSTHVSGVEAALTVDMLGVVDSQSNATWTHSINRSESHDVNGNQLPGIPVWELSQQTSMRHGDNLRVGHTYSYTAGNYWDSTNFYLSPPRSIHGAFIRATRKVLSIELSILNLTNVMTAMVDRNPLSAEDNDEIEQPITDFMGYPLPGRTWLMTLRYGG